MFRRTVGKGTGCSVPSRWRRQQISFIRVGACGNSLPKVTRRGRPMSTSGRSSVSVNMSGISLPALSRRAAASSESSVGASFVGIYSSCSDSSSFGSTPGSVSNWRAGSDLTSTSGSFPTERPLRSDTYRWSYGWGHASSSENESSSTCRNSSTGSPSGETKFSTKRTTKGRVRVAFSMSINCREVRQEQASAAGFSRPGTYHNVRLYYSRNWDQRACRGVSGRGHV